MLKSALAYLQMGYSVIPCKSARKGGALVQWARYQTERASEEDVKGWFSEGSTVSGVGIVTGAISSCLVLDFDRHGENDGVRVAESVHGWEAEGPLASTGGGGLHAYYQHPSGKIQNVIGLEPGIDLKADGGFVYAPPSLHPSGKKYAWLEPLVPPSELPVLPQWVVDKLRQTPQYEEPESEIGKLLMAGVAEGKRNDTATKIAGFYLAQGLDRTAVMLILRGWNGRNKPPLPDAELETVLDSIRRKERAKRGENVENLDRDLILQGIGDSLHIPLQDIKRIGGADPKYRFTFDGRYADVRARDIGSQWSWAREIIALTAHVPRTLKAGQWQETLQRMLNLAEYVDPGEEATMEGELRAWLQSYFEALPPRKESEESSQPEDPRHAGDDVCIHIGHLRRYVRARFDVPTEHKAVVQQLVALGFGRKTVNIALPGGKRTSRSMWIVPEEFLP